MKVILALFLCGVAYSTASPTCSESELHKCSEPAPNDEDYMTPEKKLNYLCKSMECFKEYKRRCGVQTTNAYYKLMFVHSEKIYRAVCDTDSQALRRKFLDNIKCINRQQNYLNECSIEKVIEIGDPDFCPIVKNVMDCTKDFIGRECGKDARDVYVALSQDLELYGCKE